MSVEEASHVLNGAVRPLNQPALQCTYLSPRGWPDGISFMVVNGHIARVDVRARGFATPRGAQVGSTEHEIRALYAGHIDVRPHKYTEGHYLIVTPAAPGATRQRLVFETDGEKVERYHAGVLPAVEWVEGCA